MEFFTNNSNQSVMAKAREKKTAFHTSDGKEYPIFKSVRTGRATHHFFRDPSGKVWSEVEIENPHSQEIIFDEEN